MLGCMCLKCPITPEKTESCHNQMTLKGQIFTIHEDKKTVSIDYSWESLLKILKNTLD